jgi:hypothetical protein
MERRQQHGDQFLERTAWIEILASTRQAAEDNSD